MKSKLQHTVNLIDQPSCHSHAQSLYKLLAHLLRDFNSYFSINKQDNAPDKIIETSDQAQFRAS